MFGFLRKLSGLCRSKDRLVVLERRGKSSRTQGFHQSKPGEIQNPHNREDSLQFCETALDVLEKHGLHARRYVAGRFQDEPELRAALRLLASKGYIVFDANQSIFGDLEPPRPTSDEMALLRRKSIKMVKAKNANSQFK